MIEGDSELATKVLLLLLCICMPHWLRTGEMQRFHSSSSCSSCPDSKLTRVDLTSPQTNKRKISKIKNESNKIPVFVCYRILTKKLQIPQIWWPTSMTGCGSVAFVKKYRVASRTRVSTCGWCTWRYAVPSVRTAGAASDRHRTRKLTSCHAPWKRWRWRKAWEEACHRSVSIACSCGVTTTTETGRISCHHHQHYHTLYLRHPRIRYSNLNPVHSLTTRVRSFPKVSSYFYRLEKTHDACWQCITTIWLLRLTTYHVQ